MHKTLVLKIKRKSIPQWLILGIVMMPFLYYVFFNILKLPRFIITYCFDVCWLGLFFYNIINDKSIKRSEARSFRNLVCAFLLYTAVAYIFNYQSIFYYLWGLRNSFRFYVFFIAVICFLNREHIADYLKTMEVVFWINFILSVIQFYVFEQRGDITGGVFGTFRGVNSYTILLMSIVLSRSILMYLQHEEKTAVCILKVSVSLVVAALAELKVFFLILLLIIMMAFLIVEFSWRKLWVVVGGILAIIVGTTLLGKVFGDGTNEWFNINNLLNLAFSERGYTYSGDLNRLAAISQINQRFNFKWHEKLFGLGLGNCDTSSVALFNSPFSDRYFDMHHTWLSVAMLYLETGYVGLGIYVGLFVLCFVMAKKKKHEAGNELYSMMTMIMAVICCVLTPYNASLRTESAYMMYFVLALPFIRQAPAAKKNILKEG